MEALSTPRRMCVTFEFWVLGGENGVIFWSRDKPLHFCKWLLGEAQSTVGMVCVATIKREERGMIWLVRLTFREENVQKMDFCGVSHFNFNNNLIHAYYIFTLSHKTI